MTGTHKDPVCGMEVTYATAQAQSQYKDETYYFCSLDCKQKFDENPERYVTQHEEQHEHHH
jgi:YHS domain-containing protein